MIRSIYSDTSSPNYDTESGHFGQMVPGPPERWPGRSRCVLRHELDFEVGTGFLQIQTKNLARGRRVSWSMLRRPSAPEWISKWQKWNQHRKLHIFFTKIFLSSEF